MDLPALFPEHLLYVEVATSDEELLSLLQEISRDFVSFFEVASDDETWSEKHESFMRQSLEWFTEQTYQNNLSQDDIHRIATAIKNHYPVLRPYIPHNIQVKVNDGTIPCNGLLLAASSHFLKQAVLKECRNKKNVVFSFPSTTAQLFALVKQFVYTGFVIELLVMGEEDIITLLRLASSLEINELSHLCQRMLAKYLTTDNLLSMFLQARKEHWSLFQQKCAYFIDQNNLGFRLHLISSERIGFEFCKFEEESLSFFTRFLPMITDLICHGALVEDPQFGKILKKLPKLIGLDISRTAIVSPYLFEVSKGVQEIDLSECPWVSQEALRQILSFCPNVIKLALCGDFHLNYLAWGELAKFQGLKGLNLAACQQIQDDDLSIIIRGCSGLIELSLSYCQKVGEAGFQTLANGLPNLRQLDVSRCRISDTALVEIASRCHRLTSLNIASCDPLTEKGILALVKTSSSLRELDITRCRLSAAAIDLIKSKIQVI